MPTVGGVAQRLSAMAWTSTEPASAGDYGAGRTRGGHSRASSAEVTVDHGSFARCRSKVSPSAMNECGRACCGSRCDRSKPYRVTTDSAHTKPIAANVLDRRFEGWAINRAWVANLTYVATEEGWLYLACVLDLGSRRVVGWSMSERMQAKLVCGALTMAYWHRKPPPGLIMHSDRGVQYAGDEHRKLIAQYRMVQSMSRKGNCWDNSADGELLQDVESGVGESIPIRDARAGTTRSDRLDRGLLQCAAPAFVDRLPVTGGVRETSVRGLSLVYVKSRQGQINRLGYKAQGPGQICS